MEQLPNSQSTDTVTEGCRTFFTEQDEERDRLEPIAVIGYSLKFPQDATSPEDFWQMLLHGRSAMTEVPKDRWNIDGFYHPNPDRHDSMNCRGGHFLKENIALFDAPFFSFTPTEAACLDPHQRSLLECTYHALENSGVPMEKAVGSRTSVHVGSITREYESLFARDPQLHAKYLATGTGPSMLANRLSWFYDFHGPSVTLETACSSSLYAFHLAVQALRSGESDMGIVAASSLMVNPDTFTIPLSNLGFLSPDSKCHSFDHRANGYARGEGTAVVVLKRLSQAIQDGDVMRAVIRATGVNQDGKTPGITQPSVTAQEAMIRETYASAGLRFNDTAFFEAHGPGTAVGDPIEASAIGAVFRERATPLFIGAVKSNIGHLEGVSGLAGLIKAILVLEKGIIPRNIWFEKVNPNIDTQQLNIQFPTESTKWPSDGLRRASVNSFGYGGSNAHVVLDDAYNYCRDRGLIAKHCSAVLPPCPDIHSSALDRRTPYSGENDNGYSKPGDPTLARHSRLFVWSSSDEGGIARLAARYREHVLQLADRDLDNLAYSLSERRSNLPWKSFLVARSIEDIYEKLSKNQLSVPIRSSSLQPTLGFIFTGQGAQWYAMGRELSVYPVFLNSLRSAQKYFKLLGCTWMLIDELQRSEELSNINNPRLAQPLCTVLQIALIDLLATWNVFPSAVVGHSSGEIAAAYCAGGISRESAWKIAYFRGALAGRLVETKQRNGSMVAVALSETDIQHYLDQVAVQYGPCRLSVGCINSPVSVTVTGDEECVNALRALMNKERIFCRKLQVTIAYHSFHMEDVAAEYQKLIEDIIPRQWNRDITLPVMFSSVTCEHVRVEQLEKPDYWVSNMVRPVRFSDALSKLCSNAYNGSAPAILVEIGPHAALRRPVKETLDAISLNTEVAYDVMLMQNVSAAESTLELMGRLHSKGCNIDFLEVNSPGTSTLELQLLPNLPLYPFDHSQQHWLESRLSRNFRFRKLPRHELLGTPSTDWNPLEGKWRNIIRVSENPWIRDHKFNGTEIYPAAGMMIMALEAARQMARPDLMLTGYTFKDVSFFKPLLVSLAAEGVETEIYLRPRQIQNSSSSHNVFHIYLYMSEEWTEICNGTIVTEYKDSIGGFQANSNNSLGHRDASEFGVDECKRLIDSKELYKNLESFGYAFGPTFQTLEQVRFNNNGKAVATIDPRAWMTKVPQSAMVQNHVIHPTALDALLHLTIVALSKGASEFVPTMVPTRVQKLWISNELLIHTQDQKLRLRASSTFRGYRDAEFAISAYDSTDKQCLILIEGYRGTAISSVESSVPEWKRLCYDIQWKPDADKLREDQLSSYCSSFTKRPDSLAIDLYNSLELLALHFMSMALETMDNKPLEVDKWHNAKHIQWLQSCCDQYEKGLLLPSLIDGRPSLKNKSYFQTLTASTEDCLEKTILVTIGDHLAQLLQHRIELRETFISQGPVEDLYARNLLAPSISKLVTYLDLLAHKNPTLKIVEIGASVGNITVPFLETLGRNDRHQTGVPRFSEYMCTDLSPGFLAQAVEQFRDFEGRMAYQVLDIQIDPIRQGFKAGAYDIVIASMILHKVVDVGNALRNVLKLLKPGGKLLLCEPCDLVGIRTSLVSGILSGRLLDSENPQPPGAYFTRDGWDLELRRAGFNGVKAYLPDFEDDRHAVSTIISTAPNATVTYHSKRCVLVVSVKTTAQHGIANQVGGNLASLGLKKWEVIEFHDLLTVDLRGCLCVFLVEMDRPLLYEMQEREFNIVKNMFTSTSDILWVTRGRENRPEMGLITGLSRSFCSENPNLNFTELAIEERSSNSEAAEHIIEVLREVLESSDRHNETEYMELSGLVSVSRVVENDQLDEVLQSKLFSRKAEMKKRGNERGRNLELTIGTPGLLNTLQFIPTELNDGVLGPDEVEIQVEATGVNFKDVMIALGQIPSSTIGLECSGTILRVGHEVSAADLQIGDRVCCIVMGAYKSRIRTYAAAVSKIPATMSFTTAAAIPLVFCTVYYAVVVLGRLSKGESILIHSGAGGVGQVAIQIAQMIEAEVYATVGSMEKARVLTSLYGIPESNIFVGRGPSFVPALKAVARGVDVVLNSLSGEGLRQSLDCVLPFGRFIDLSKTDIQNSEPLSMSPFSRNISYSSVDLELVYYQSKPLIGQLMKSVMSLVYLDKIHTPQPLTTFKSSSLEEAYRFLQGGKSTGKAVIEIRDDDVVPIIPRTSPTYQFDPDASYLIAGGLGGLGRSIVRWMIDRKAKNFILLGRSSTQSQAVLEFLDEMNDCGATIVAPPCDISDDKALKSVIESLSPEMRRIKGCIQASMVIRDRLLENMSFEDYNAAIKPKVQGSWNLATYLPKNMDFFILLSSAGGVLGTRGQSNYASANTYQDALARHLVTQGQKCISLDLGLVLSVGFASENPESINSTRQFGYRAIHERELHALLDSLCNPAWAVCDPLASQIVTGIEIPDPSKDKYARNNAVWAQRPLFCHLQRLNASQVTAVQNSDADTNYEALFQAAAGVAAKAVPGVVNVLKEKLAKTLSIPVQDIDAQRPAHTYGIDSLVAVEIRYWLAKEMKADVSIFEITGSKSIAELGVQVAEKSSFIQSHH